MKARFPFSDLPPDLQRLICEHTMAIFAVESDFTIRLRFPEVGWTRVPYVAAADSARFAREPGNPSYPDPIFAPRV